MTTRKQSEARKYGNGRVKKLNNEAFISKAKPEVVEEQRERRAEADAVRHKLADAVKRISA